MTDPDLVLLLLADARLPVAGHTQSGTVEAALAHGMAAADVPSYVRTRLRTVARIEAGTAVVSRHLVVTGRADSLAEVEAAWAARTPSAALRDASRGQARGLLRLAGQLWPDGPGLAAVRALPRPSRPVALGALAADLGQDARALARLVGYDDAQTVCAASLKLAPLDPAEVTGWVYAAFEEIEALVTEVAGLGSPDRIPAVGCPQIEHWAQLHATSTRRLFRA